MPFTVKTRGCLKYKISSRLTWRVDVCTVTYSRSDDFRRIKILYGVPLRAIRARESSASIIDYYYYIYSQLLPINTVFLPGPSRRLAPVLKCRRFLSFFQRYIVRDISLTEIYRWLIEILSAILKRTRHGGQSRERL